MNTAQRTSKKSNIARLPWIWQHLGVFAFISAFLQAVISIIFLRYLQSTVPYTFVVKKRYLNFPKSISGKCNLT